MINLMTLLHLGYNYMQVQPTASMLIVMQKITYNYYSITTTNTVEHF